jgi:hypothetical protein
MALTFISIVERGKHHKALYRCDCGVEKIIRMDHVKRGATISCGCAAKSNGETHGGSNLPEYRIWESMIRRCYKDTDSAYHYYGARGIRVCDRWRHSFSNFLSDLGCRPSDNHQIERNDNDGDYCPENCRWATRKEQCRNRRNSHFVEYDGDRKTLAEWEDITGIQQDTIRRRLEMGWDIYRALTQPAVRTPPPIRKKKSIAA